VRRAREEMSGLRARLEQLEASLSELESTPTAAEPKIEILSDKER
jgi:BMFP domain-containing protein YqiC